ncbi:AraC family transcriptional regulator [Caldimonas brevitalea]|uniref:AraC family transcriptional regulator n=1 Tax=Caldimonas brevitalea TaxID=413882 RepID=A0A0G3BN41_9BURK|nr:AraC family transcriptional regulator [Caldimonas brevitalea]AKJ30817.1 AraC family transcriptional regulator [Caldimonas brevitalea]
MAPVLRHLRVPPLPRIERNGELIARALVHIETHLDELLDASTLADHAAMSRHHFHRMFRAYVGCSVAAYVTWRRLQRACALLASGREPVLDIALAVGYESAQALAKALRRELGTTATAVRNGDAGPWSDLLSPGRWPRFQPHRQGDPIMQPTRHATLPEGIVALTATARGMVDHQMTRSAQQAFGELYPAVAARGLLPQVSSIISIVPDEPKGPDDPHCRYVGGFVFGHSMLDGTGTCRQPELPLTGTLAWQPLQPGRYAVFTHRGPYSGLQHTWAAIYRDWLPASGEQLRDAPPLELCINTPQTAAPEDLHTEIWIPVEA